MAFDLPHSVADIQFLNSPPALVAEYVEGPQSPNLFDCRISGVQGAMRGEIKAAKDKIEDFAALPENWDGYGAIQISEETKINAQSALEYILRHAPVPDITPNPNGTLSFEWETARGIGHLEIGRTRFSFYIKPCSGTPMLADGSVSQITEDFGRVVAIGLFPAQHGAKTMTTITYPLAA
jgi:hypothetical protein